MISKEAAVTIAHTLGYISSISWKQLSLGERWKPPRDSENNGDNKQKLEQACTQQGKHQKQYNKNLNM